MSERVLLICGGMVLSSNDPDAGKYLKAYDPDTEDGAGRIEWTTEREEAMVFENSVAAMNCWRQVSKTMPLRLDGKPNRPLTRYTVMSEPVD